MAEKEEFQGIKAAVPVILGYIPIGLAFGVLAAQAGLSPFDVMLMSLLVYAGSSQFIAIGLLSSGASWGTIVMTTFLVNSRHLLMSAALAPHIKHFPSRSLPVISFGITDETFAVSISEAGKTQLTPRYMLGLNMSAHLFWVCSTVCGAGIGNIIPNPQDFGLHYALPAMFIGLLVIQLKDRLLAAIALTAAGMSLFFKVMLPGNWYVLLSAIIAATIGVMIEGWKKESSYLRQE